MYLFSKRKQLNLPPRLRNLLRKPLGTIIEGEERFASFTAEKAVRWIKREEPLMLITVGDIVTRSLRNAGIKSDIAVKDFRSRRKKLSYGRQSKKKRILNPPGTIRQDAVKELRKLIDKAYEKQSSSTLIIKGEEDLLALPAMLLAPLNTVVVYGQADLGIILIKINEKVKEKAAAIVKQFE